MPELPELEGLAAFLDQRTARRELVRLELGSLPALKTVSPPLQDLLGQRVRGWGRRGKFLHLDLERDHLVLHLGRAGWVRWYERLSGTRIRISRGPLALRLGLGGEPGAGEGPGLDVTEAGTERRLAIWAVADPQQVPQLRALGREALDPGLDAAALGALLASAKGALKSALTDQSLLAGIGNAYSDEILHAARLSPLRPAHALSSAELEAVHGALRAVLGGAVDAARSMPPDRLKEAKAAAMRVHGRSGQTCPDCGDTVRQVAYASRSWQYCPGCQTGGRVLADRRLSRLLR